MVVVMEIVIVVVEVTFITCYYIGEYRHTYIRNLYRTINHEAISVEYNHTTY